MKAVVNERYGSPDILELRDIPTPKPQAGEILIKIHATTVAARIAARFGRIRFS